MSVFLRSPIKRSFPSYSANPSSFAAQQQPLQQQQQLLQPRLLRRLRQRLHTRQQGSQLQQQQMQQLLNLQQQQQTLQHKDGPTLNCKGQLAVYSGSLLLGAFMMVL